MYKVFVDLFLMHVFSITLLKNCTTTVGTMLLTYYIWRERYCRLSAI